MSNKVQYNVLFKLLRKSTHLLSLGNDDAWRKRIIQLKYQLSKLDPQLYAYMNYVANNIGRFEVRDLYFREGGSTLMVMKDFGGSQDTICLLSSSELGRSQNIPLVAIEDLISGKWMAVVGEKVYADGEVIFEGSDAAAFAVTALCLRDMKNTEYQFQKRMRADNVKNDYLSDYGA